MCVNATDGGQCNFPANPSIVGGSSDPWVAQDVWSHAAGYYQTLHASSPISWYVVANANTHFGGVLTYPDTGFWMTGTIDGYSSITSSFSTTIPVNSITAGWAAYDLWFNNWGEEVMIQTDATANSDYNCTAKTTATFGGIPWHLCVFGSERVWKPGTNDQNYIKQPTGSVNIKAMLTWMEQKGYLDPGSTWTAASYGFEICDTGGTNEDFRVNNFTWTAEK